MHLLVSGAGGVDEGEMDARIGELGRTDQLLFVKIGTAEPGNGFFHPVLGIEQEDPFRSGNGLQDRAVWPFHRFQAQHRGRKLPMVAGQHHFFGKEE